MKIVRLSAMLITAAAIDCRVIGGRHGSMFVSSRALKVAYRTLSGGEEICAKSLGRMMATVGAENTTAGGPMARGYRFRDVHSKAELESLFRAIARFEVHDGEGKESAPTECEF